MTKEIVDLERRPCQDFPLLLCFGLHPLVDLDVTPDAKGNQVVQVVGLTALVHWLDVVGL